MQINGRPQVEVSQLLDCLDQNLEVRLDPLAEFLLVFLLCDLAWKVVGENRDLEGVEEAVVLEEEQGLQGEDSQGPDALALDLVGLQQGCVYVHRLDLDQVEVQHDQDLCLMVGDVLSGVDVVAEVDQLVQVRGAHVLELARDKKGGYSQELESLPGDDLLNQNSVENAHRHKQGSVGESQFGLNL